MTDGWTICAEMLRDNGVLEDARARGITVQHSGCSTSVMFDGGLTKEHYNSLAPLLSTDIEKAVLALGVIENKLHPISCVDWMDVKSIIERNCGDFEDWLPRRVSAKGLDAIATLIKNWWLNYRRTNPAPRVELVAVTHPVWSGKILSFGSKSWEFRKLPGRPLNEVLDEFERQNWNTSVTLSHLEPEQVRDVAKLLREKTKGYINWSASCDCMVGWWWDR